MPGLREHRALAVQPRVHRDLAWPEMQGQLSSEILTQFIIQQ